MIRDATAVAERSPRPPLTPSPLQSWKRHNPSGSIIVFIMVKSGIKHLLIEDVTMPGINRKPASDVSPFFPLFFSAVNGKQDRSSSGIACKRRTKKSKKTSKQISTKGEVRTRSRRAKQRKGQIKTERQCWKKAKRRRRLIPSYHETGRENMKQTTIQRRGQGQRACTQFQRRWWRFRQPVEKKWRTTRERIETTKNKQTNRK